MMKTFIYAMLVISACLMFLAGCRTAERDDKIPQVMVEQVVNNAKLKPYLHPGVDGRVPVVLSDHLLAPSVALTKFGRPVCVMPDASLSGGAFIRFHEFVMDDNQAVLTFRYKIEGVGGKCSFRRAADGSWNLADMQVWEN